MTGVRTCKLLHQRHCKFLVCVHLSGAAHGRPWACRTILGSSHFQQLSHGILHIVRVLSEDESKDFLIVGREHGNETL